MVPGLTNISERTIKWNMRWSPKIGEPMIATIHKLTWSVELLKRELLGFLGIDREMNILIQKSIF